MRLLKTNDNHSFDGRLYRSLRSKKVVLPKPYLHLKDQIPYFPMKSDFFFTKLKKFKVSPINIIGKKPYKGVLALKSDIKYDNSELPVSSLLQIQKSFISSSRGFLKTADFEIAEKKFTNADKKLFLAKICSFQSPELCFLEFYDLEDDKWSHQKAYHHMRDLLNTLYENKILQLLPLKISSNHKSIVYDIQTKLICLVRFESNVHRAIFLQKDAHEVYLFRLVDEGKIIALTDLKKVYRIPDDFELQKRPVTDFIFGSKFPNLVIPCQIRNLPDVSVTDIENRFVLVDFISKPPNSRRKLYQIDWHNLEIKEKWQVNVFTVMLTFAIDDSSLVQQSRFSRI